MRLLIIAIIIIASAASSVALNPDGRLADPITYSADSTTGSKTPTDEIRHFYGRVVFRQRNVVLRCEEAIYNLVTKKAELLRGVIITQEDMTLKSPRIDYDGNTGIAVAPQSVTISDKNAKLRADKGVYNTNTYVADFRGAVKIVDDSSTILSERLIYNRKTRFSEAYGAVKIETDSVVITSDSATYSPNDGLSSAFGSAVVRAKFAPMTLFADFVADDSHKKKTLAYGSPIMYRVDSTRTDSTVIFDTLEVSSDTMRAEPYKNDRNFFFLGPTEIIRNRLAAKCAGAVYSPPDQKIELRGTPKIWFDSTILLGDSIFIKLDGNSLEKIDSEGDALALTVSDTRRIRPPSNPRLLDDRASRRPARRL